MKNNGLLLALLFLVFTLPAITYAQEAAAPQPIKASCYYPDLEPKQLFQMLSETYHVQFDGIELVSGPVTLISREKVDVNGMIVLLNEVLLKQNRKAILNGQIIMITQIQDIDQVIKLSYLKPDETVSILKKRFMPPGQEGDNKNKKPSMIEPHPNGDSIIVRGPEKVIKEIQSYLAEIDLPVAGAGTKPAQTKPTITPTIPTSDVAGLLKSNIPEIVIRSIDLNNPVTDEILDYLKEVYLVSPNASAEERARKVYNIHKHPKLRKIVVEGPDYVIDEMERVIKEELDVAPPGPPVMQRYITLNYISVESFQALMENNPTLKGKYTATEERNNVIVVDTQDETIFPVIEDLKKKFDIDKKELRFIPLSYANADDVTNLLNQIYKSAPPETPQELIEAQADGAENSDLTTEKIKQRISKVGINDASFAERISQSLALVNQSEYTIVSDKVRNALIVYTFSRNFPKIMQMIAQLDVAQQMVYIEVFITQVNKSNNKESGVQWDYANQYERDGHIGSYTATSRFNDFDSIPGLSYEVLDHDFKMSLKAMVTSGNIDVISRPHLVTKNNIWGEISLGNKVPQLESLETRYDQAYISRVKYDDVTTKLRVKPQIHPDKFISLEIEQTVDDISTETFQITQDFNPQIINKREAKVNLRIKNGQTVCLAGFTGDKINEMEDKVPLLGDIPLVGLLFKHSYKKREKVEMIIFLTPHILDTPEDSLRMTNDLRSRSKSEKRDDRLMETLQPQDYLVDPKYSIDPETPDTDEFNTNTVIDEDKIILEVPVTPDTEEK